MQVYPSRSISLEIRLILTAVSWLYLYWRPISRVSLLIEERLLTIVFYRTQDHLIQDDGQLESAWGGTKTWPAMFMLVVASISAILSISILPKSLLIPPFPDLPLLHASSLLTGSRAIFLSTFSQMGKPFRNHGRKFHDRCISRLSPHMGNLCRPIPQSRSPCIQYPEHLVLGMQP
jgi:hypothetical protein